MEKRTSPENTVEKFLLKSFERVAIHDFYYRKYKNFDYFKIAPLRFLVLKILSFVQFFYFEKIRKIIGLDGLVKTAAYIEKKIGQYPGTEISSNLTLLRMANLKHMFKETYSFYSYYHEIRKIAKSNL